MKNLFLLTVISCALLFLSGCNNTGDVKGMDSASTAEPSCCIGYGISNLSVVNHHEEPAVENEIGCQTLMGTVLMILERRDDWLKVEAPSGYKAWVTSSSIVEMDVASLKEWLQAEKWLVTTNAGTILEQPHVNSPVIKDITLGDIIMKGGNDEGDYFSCILPDGLKAYVKKDCVTDYNTYLDTVSVSGDALAETAKKFIGFPYVWGWNCAKGMDCSGLTQFVYGLHGIILPRNASQQAKIGMDVNIENGLSLLHSGDLLFFCNSVPGKITHVGMYLGDGLFIHSGTNCVKINSLDPQSPICYPGYENLYCARRILGTEDCVEIIKNLATFVSVPI